MKHTDKQAWKTTSTTVINQEFGENWALYNGDCCQLVKGLPDASIGLSIFSPPFSNLYIYSESAFDMGNSVNDDEFFQHFGYLIPELKRVTVPGRLCVVHCKDLPKYRNRDGVAGLKDFPGEIVRLFESHGWTYHSRVTIWKCPVVEMERTKNHGLLHKTVRADSSAVRQGMADYLVVFRNPPREGLLSDEPVSRPSGFDEWNGAPEFDPRINDWHPSKYARKGKMAKGDPKINDSIRIWQRMADPVWWHIDQQDVLNYQLGKDSKDEKHICIAEGTMVLTESGYKPIEAIEIGERVLTHKGRWRSVVAKVCNGERDVVNIQAGGVPGLRATHTHPIYVRRGFGGNHDIGYCRNQREYAMRCEPEWVNASESLGHYVNLPLPPISEEYKKYDLTDSEWWIVGRWIGDGHTDTRGRLHISCSYDETESLVSAMGIRAGHVADTGTSHQISIKDRDGKIRRVVQQCGKGAVNKRICGDMLAMPSDIAAFVLSGYLSADGHYVPQYDRHTASSVSKELMLGVAILAQRVRGVSCSVYAGRKGGRSFIQGRPINTLPDWVLSIPPKNVSAFMTDEGAWKKVRKVSEDGKAIVWDIQVEEDESFVAEGCVVHNCPLQKGVIREAVGLWSNPGDVVLSPFSGIGSEGAVSVAMSRKFVGFELKESYFKQAILNIREAEKSLNERDLFSDFDPDDNNDADIPSEVES